MTTSDDELTVRTAGPADAEAIAAVHVAGWRRAFAGVVDDGFLAGLDAGRRAERWRRMPSEPAERAAVLVTVRVAGPARSSLASRGMHAW